MLFLEFYSRFSDLLHGTGNNRSMKIRILEKLDNFEKIK
jgi:hypothetical protein